MKKIDVIQKTIMIVFSMITMIYVFFRAYLTSFTHDESLTFSITEGNSVLLNTANHHHLNTLLVSLIKKLFGSSEIILRMPNIIAFGVFLLSIYFIIRKSKNLWIYLFGIIIMLSNPFLIEFFSLSRGYGISIGFFTLSLYFIIRSSSNYSDYAIFFKDYILALFFASLALWSNLAMINYLICLLLLFGVRFIFFVKDKINYRKNNLLYFGITILTLVPLFLGLKRLMFLKTLNQLYFGTDSFVLTIESLIISANYTRGTNPYVVPTIKILLILSMVVGLVSIIKKKEFKGPLFLVISILLIITLGIHFEHYLFGANYPMKRTALLYVPLFSLFSFHLIAHLNNHYKVKIIIYPLLLLIVTPLFINFHTAWNFTNVKSWSFDAHTKEAMQTIRKTIKKNHLESKELVINNHWLFEPTINYYLTSWKLNIKPALKQKEYLYPDFIYRRKDVSEMKDFKVIKRFEDPESSLLIKESLLNLSE